MKEANPADSVMRYTSQIIRLLTGRFVAGFCHHCEREAEWVERDHYYRCSACGHDPLLHKPETDRPSLRRIDDVTTRRRAA